jgi:pyruvate/2-oxoglutarate dehydrogenase complex dihydrolipoamide dehydrogenase (E3) component
MDEELLFPLVTATHARGKCIVSAGPITFSAVMDRMRRRSSQISQGQHEGLEKIDVEKGKDGISGATIASADAGDMASEVSLAMEGNLGLGHLSRVIHSYPTRACPKNGVFPCDGSPRSAQSTLR